MFGRQHARQWVTDALLWVLLCVPALTQSRWGAGGVVLITVAVLVSRRLPLLSLLAPLIAGPWGAPGLALATVTMWPFGETARLGPLDGFSPAIAAFAFLAGRRMSNARPVIRAYALIFGVGAVISLVTTLGPMPEPNPWISTLSGVLFISYLPWAAGRFVRHRGERRDLTLERARLRERARIADDMHDALGHELALIALRAGALEMAADLPEHHREAAKGLRESAGAATERLRRAIGLLREDGESAPLETRDITALVQRARASGMPVTLDQRADVSDPASAAYRVVQEGLTNAAKHAPGRPVTVLLERREGDLIVQVRNGTGLAALSERVRLAGGTFEITARLPEKTR